VAVSRIGEREGLRMCACGILEMTIDYFTFATGFLYLTPLILINAYGNITNAFMIL